MRFPTPTGTELVESSVTEDVVYDAENGTLTRKKTVSAKTTRTVKFDVKVVEGGLIVYRKESTMP